MYIYIYIYIIIDGVQVVSRLLEMEEGVRRVLSSDRKTARLILTWQDIDVLKSIDKVLSQLSPH